MIRCDTCGREYEDVGVLHCTNCGNPFVLNEDDIKLEIEKYGKVPLILNIVLKDYDMTKYLLIQCRADVNVKSKEGKGIKEYLLNWEKKYLNKLEEELFLTTDLELIELANSLKYNVNMKSIVKDMWNLDFKSYNKILKEGKLNNFKNRKLLYENMIKKDFISDDIDKWKKIRNELSNTDMLISGFFEVEYEKNKDELEWEQKSFILFMDNTFFYKKEVCDIIYEGLDDSEKKEISLNVLMSILKKKDKRAKEVLKYLFNFLEGKNDYLKMIIILNRMKEEKEIVGTKEEIILDAYKQDIEKFIDGTKFIENNSEDNIKTVINEYRIKLHVFNLLDLIEKNIEDKPSLANFLLEKAIEKKIINYSNNQLNSLFNDNIENLLHLAVKLNNDKIVHNLINKEITNKSDIRNITPVDLGVKKGYQKIVLTILFYLSPIAKLVRLISYDANEEKIKHKYLSVMKAINVIVFIALLAGIIFTLILLLYVGKDIFYLYRSHGYIMFSKLWIEIIMIMVIFILEINLLMNIRRRMKINLVH